MKNLTGKQIKEIKKLRKTGLSCSKISRQLDIGEQTVYYHVNESVRKKKIKSSIDYKKKNREKTNEYMKNYQKKKYHENKEYKQKRIEESRQRNKAKKENPCKID